MSPPLMLYEDIMTLTIGISFVKIEEVTVVKLSSKIGSSTCMMKASKRAARCLGCSEVLRYDLWMRISVFNSTCWPGSR